MSYKLLAIEGSGAYGTVAKARDIRHGRQLVALKILREDHVDNPRVLSRTRDEALLLSRLEHPAIVGMHRLDETLGRPIMVMEWLEAIPLSDLIDHQEGGLPIDVSCEMVAQASLALDYAYQTPQGDPPRPLKLVHRDIKPSNMLLTIGGQVKIVDFGLAHGDFDEKQAQTVSMVLGTRAYMAPERLDGAEDHPSADVYAMGMVLSELLIGRPIRLSLNPRKQEAMLHTVLEALPLGDLSPRARDRVRGTIEAMCAYEPHDRPSHREVSQELQTAMALGGLAPDVHAYARRIVKPMVSSRQRVPAQEHPAYDDVKFIEAPISRITIGAPYTMDPSLTDYNDERIRALLNDRRWTAQLPRLRAILRDPAWTPAPFLEVIDQATGDDKRQVDPRKVAMCINLLRVRPLPNVIERARALLTHPDPLVSTTARQFLDSIQP